MKKRLEVYHDQTEILLDYYSKEAASNAKNAPKYRKIAGVGPIEKIRKDLLEALK